MKNKSRKTALERRMDRMRALEESGRLATKLTSRTARKILSNKLAVLGAALFLIICILCLAAPLFTRWQPGAIALSDRMAKPSGAHLFGTDQMGRDIWARILYGGRVSIVVGLGSALGAAVIGVTLGMFVGYKGGWADRLILRISVVFLAFPRMVLIIIMVALNCMGAKVGGAAPTIFTVAQLIPLVLIMIFGFIRGNGNPIFDPMLGEGLKFGSVLGQLMIAVLFAYEGWTNVGAIAGEMKDPGRDLPKAIVGGVALIMAVYIIINLAYLWVLPADVMMNLESPASAVAMQIFGNMGGKIVSVGIMISAGGACNGFILSGSRTALYMAEQGDLPGSKALSKISGTGVPINCIFLIGILGAIYALTGQFDLLTNLGTFVGWVFYTLTFLAVMAYRKQAPDLKRTYKVPAYPVIPIIAIISGLYVLLNQLFMAGHDARKVAVGGIILVLIGLPVRAIFTKKKAA